MAVATFSVWDYVVFALVLLVSASIGVYFGCTGGKQSTTREFLMADRSMKLLPVAVSMLASFMSAIMLLGTPAEIYMFGLEYTCIGLGYILLVPITAYLYIPVFYRLQLTSAYEYLEIRFNSKLIRMIGSATFILQMIMYMAIVLYAPSLALNAVTGFNLWASVFSVGIICTFYTSLGGMKAVMWTDVFQVTMMLVGLLAVLVQGSIDHGGMGAVWETARLHGRVNFLDFDPDPRQRHTFWSLVFGGLFTWLAIYAVNQSQVQRALTCPDLRTAQIAMLLNAPGLIILMVLTTLCGLLIFSQYQHCDPIRNGQIFARDQLLPLYVIETLHQYKGVPGLFIACIFSGSLSTVSSGLNSLAAVTIQDFVRGYWCPHITESKATFLSKVIAIIYGVIMMGLTVVAAQLGGVLQAALAMFGIIGGPLLGLFTLAILFPCANSKGALVGVLVGFSFQLWVGVGAMIYKPVTQTLPTSIAGCVNTTGVNFTLTGVNHNLTDGQYDFTSSVTHYTTPLHHTDSGAHPQGQVMGGLYSLSYLWYSLVATLVVCSVGLLVSLITGGNKDREVDPRTVVSLPKFCSFFQPSTPEKYTEEKVVDVEEQAVKQQLLSPEKCELQTMVNGEKRPDKNGEKRPDKNGEAQ